MTNKSLSKLLSLILTIAICATTVFSCFVTVTAEQNGPSYTITGAECAEGDAIASAIVEFNVPNGVAGGSFTIDNTGNWYSSVAVSLYSELAASTDVFDITTDNGNVVFVITDANGAPKLYSNFALKLDFEFAGNGINDDVAITISDLDFNATYTG